MQRLSAPVFTIRMFAVTSCRQRSRLFVFTQKGDHGRIGCGQHFNGHIFYRLPAQYISGQARNMHSNIMKLLRIGNATDTAPAASVG